MDLPNKATDIAAVTDNNMEEVLMPDSTTIDAHDIPNAVLQRLIDEVKSENQNNVLAYNRLHNRHNRTR